MNVICLVGERGRELREFIERDLGDALARSVVVVATSDQPALVRIKAALVATTIAEHFRDAGADVLLMMDSVTRLAIAQREIGLAIGEPPATRGYTPSVFAMLPQLLERAGTSGRGSITGLYTVLVEGDDMNEPIADAVRSILDGHCVLTRTLAHKSHYPAIDVLQSVSRLANEVTSPAVRDAAAALRETLAAYRAKEDLITIGAYSPGADPGVDYAIAKVPQIDAFLRQPADEAADASDTDLRLIELMADRTGGSVSCRSSNRQHFICIWERRLPGRKPYAGGLMSTEETTRQLVIFSLGSEEYALPITRVQEIIRYTEPRSVASQTPWIRGVINLRGKIVPVCDLAERLGLALERPEAAKIVIVETAVGTAGVIVDDVDEVLTVSPEQLEDVPTADAAYVDAVAKVGERLAILLNPDGLFAGVQIAA